MGVYLIWYTYLIKMHLAVIKESTHDPKRYVQNMLIIA